MSNSILAAATAADLFFMSKSPLHETMRRLTQVLDEMQIPFAIAGAMAANAHGHRRTTADVDVLIASAGLDRFKEKCIGRGWIDLFDGSKSFRDATTGIAVDVLLSGNYPGDGLPKPVVFPEPASVATRGIDGIPYINLTTLLELKLASGMTAAHRPRDLDDVIQLIRINQLSLEFADTLNPYVANKFHELWHAAQIVEEY